LIKNYPLEYAQVYTKALNKVGDEAKHSYMKHVVKKLRSEVFLSDEAKYYPNEMASK